MTQIVEIVWPLDNFVAKVWQGSKERKRDWKESIHDRNYLFKMSQLTSRPIPWNDTVVIVTVSYLVPSEA